MMTTKIPERGREKKNRLKLVQRVNDLRIGDINNRIIREQKVKEKNAQRGGCFFLFLFFKPRTIILQSQVSATH